MRTCTVGNCKKEFVALGFCNAHYLRFKKYGSPIETIPLKIMGRTHCVIKGCNRPHEALNFCHAHYNRLKKYGNPKSQIPIGYRDGVTKKLEYGSWRAMVSRCHSKTNHKFKDYGARGIKVCREWRNFRNFFRDMGPKPSSKHSIDRIDNFKGYFKENCRWATVEQQSKNKRAK